MKISFTKISFSFNYVPDWFSFKEVRALTCYRPECHINLPCVYCGGRRNSNNSKNIKSETGDE